MVDVLYIEDNDQNFYLVDYILKSKGHLVVRARDGKDGIRAAFDNNYDLILLDIQLPDMDGYAIAHELRKLSKLDQVPIIAVTSYAMAGDREKAMEAGCTGYIEKPINPRTFTDQVESFLQTKEDMAR